MRLETADATLRQLAERVFRTAEWLTGEQTVYHQGSGWYKCGTPILAWFYLVGPGAKKNPINSIVVTATRPDESNRGAGSQQGNNMFGVETPELVVRPDDAGSLAEYLEFIAKAYRIRYS